MIVCCTNSLLLSLFPQFINPSNNLFSYQKPLSTDKDILPALFVEKIDCVYKDNRNIDDMHVFPYI